MSNISIQDQLLSLRYMSPAGLRAKYHEVFGEPSRSGNRDFLTKRIAWRIQSLAEGTLSQRARQRAAELARDADVRTTVPRVAKTPVPTAAPIAVHSAAVQPSKRLPMPGAAITRDYRGRTIVVTVLPKGFEFEGRVYRSLSAVAKAVTGAHWNGYLFFGLSKEAEV